MAYASIEKQREYQRNWVAKNRSTVENLNTGYVTWEQLTKGNKIVTGVETWADGVKEAQQLMLSKKIDRLVMAALAMKSCVIKHGGNVFGVQHRPTLKKFAEEVGVKYKTLSNWVEIKRLVLDRLPTHLKEKPFDLCAAQIAVRHSSRKSGDMLDRYESIAYKPKAKVTTYLCRYLLAAENAIKTAQLSYLNDREMVACKRALKKLTDFFDVS